MMKRYVLYKTTHNLLYFQHLCFLNAKSLLNLNNSTEFKKIYRNEIRKLMVNDREETQNCLSHFGGVRKVSTDISSHNLIYMLNNCY